MVKMATKGSACALAGLLAGAGLGMPPALRAEPSLSPQVLQCQKGRADPAPCWSDFLAGPAPARRKALLVALSFSTSYRPARSAQSAAFLARLVQAGDQERGSADAREESACASPGCRTEDTFYAHAVRDAWRVVDPAAGQAVAPVHDLAQTPGASGAR